MREKEANIKTTGDVSGHAGAGDTLSIATATKTIVPGMERNGAGPMFCCPDCAYKTTSLRKLGRHRSVNHAGVKYRCEHCDFVTGYQSNYYRHRKQVHNGGMSQSALQAATTNSTTANQSHQQRTANRHGGTYTSFSGGIMPTTTPAQFTMNEEQQRLLAAAIVASSVAPFRCDRCSFQAGSLEQLVTHVAILHNNADGPRSCGECGITMTTKSQCQEHLRSCPTYRNQVTYAKSDYASLFGPLTNNNAAALTAAHLLMAAAANGSNGGGYDLNLLASAAALASSNGLVHQQQQQHAQSPDDAKKFNINSSFAGSFETNVDNNKFQRYYACVYDCDFAAVSSREYLHHLRDVHEERFAIFYCDQCDDYATKFVARLRRHKAIAHDGEKVDISSTGGETWKEETKNVPKLNDSFGVDTKMEVDARSEDDNDDDVGDQKLSIVVDQPNSDSTTFEEEVTEENRRAEYADMDTLDGVFRCLHCPYATNDLPCFHEHQKCHETTTDIRCKVCNFRTTDSWNMDRHIRCHQQLGKYTCRRCSFTQNTKQSVRFHLQHHHDDVKFETVATQTVDENSDWLPNVDVGFEPFVFEKHAVRVNTPLETLAEKRHTTMEEDIHSDTGLEEDVRGSMSRNCSSVDLARNYNGARHSTPTPPALLTSGASAIIQHNRRYQLHHNRIHYRRRQHQQSQRMSLINDNRRMKKFLSEQEAIEIPSDSVGNEFDNDPDIKNRHCSICGYQGKWISEMIRHKRVHTNERPFKCKYCSRTSKWKADLIRHVAKVHGYRVVSKYSRSKTFDDADQTALKALKEAVQSSSTSPALVGQNVGKSNVFPPYAAGQQDTSSPVTDNADLSEISAAYDGDEGLDLSLDARKTGQWMVKKATDTQLGAIGNGATAIKLEKDILLTPALMSGEEQRLRVNQLLRQFNGDVAPNETNANNGSNSPAASGNSPSAIGSSKDLRDFIGSKQLTGSLEKYVTIKQAYGGEAILKCRVCPYETRDLHTFRAHTQKHENKKPYLCSTCGYRSNWSSDVHKHIRLKKTGHETAYVIKLNEGDSPGQTGDLTSSLALGRAPSNSDSSSNEYVLTDSQNGSAISAEGKNVGQVTWRCLKCDFDDYSRSVVIEHLHESHQTPPYACRHCNFSSLHRKICVYHAQSQHNSRDSSIIENLVCEYRTNGSKVSVDDNPTVGIEEDQHLSENGGVKMSSRKTEDSLLQRRDNGALDVTRNQKIDNGNGSPGGSQLDQMTAAMIAANAALAASAFTGSSGQTKPIDWLQLAQLCFLGGFSMNTGNCFTSQSIPDANEANHEEGTSSLCEKTFRCGECPFIGRTESDAAVHEKGHKAPSKGLMSYKCVFCEWYAPKKAAIFDHLKLHTDEPAMYKAEVERNMVTPLSRKRGADDSAESAAANALLGLAQAEKVYKADGLDEGSSSISTPVGKDDAAAKSLIVNTSSNSSQKNGENVVLGRSDVDEVMSDFNAIIHAADQDLAQENIEDEAEFTFHRHASENGAFRRSEKYCDDVIRNQRPKDVRRSNTDLSLAASRKADARNTPGRVTCNNLERFGGVAASATNLVNAVDREAYIHAGEDAFDPISRLTDVTKGEIQKVTAVVDGQVRKMWQCRHCPHISKRRANVRMHEKKHFKSSAIGVFKCPKCNYRGDKRSLHVHYRVHMAAENGGSATMPELFQCSNCPAIFQSQEDLALHTSNHNSNLSNAYRCSLCSYSVSSSNALQKHARVHDRQLFSTSSESSLNAAADDRSIKRPYQLTRRYPSSAAIANVIVQHEEISSAGNFGDGQNETALNLVTRQGNQGALSTQSTPSPTSAIVGSSGPGTATSFMHPLMKPKKYLCTRCPAKFADRTQLNRHIQFHGVKLKFKCYICDYSVPFPINLTKHMKSHHNIDITDVSTAVALSDNENDSDCAVGASEVGDLDKGSVSSEYDDDQADDQEAGLIIEQHSLNSESVSVSPTDGRLKIKINLGALKPSPNVD